MLVAELASMARLSKTKGRRLTSIFFGGGTPSLMQPETVARILTEAAGLFQLDSTTEITLEANPTRLETGRISEFVSAGINRLSFGIQSLDDENLRFLGRQHSAAEALAAIETARQLTDRVSCDFIYALPGQEITGWQAELEQILGLGLDHLSLYQLTLEPGTQFYSRHRRGLMTMPDELLTGDMFRHTRDRLAAAGLPGYEVSNHARPGQESLHNLVYWQAGDWLGIGPGAHGRFWLDGLRWETRCRRHPDAWLDQVARDGSAIDGKQAEAPQAYATEALMMGLRLQQGVALDSVEAHAGPRDQWLDTAAVERFADAGLVILEDKHLRLAEDGLVLLNSILGKLLLE